MVGGYHPLIKNCVSSSKIHVNEFSNKDIYDKIKEKIANMIEEDL